MTRLSPGSRNLLEQFRAAERLDSQARERMQQGLFEKIARGETALAGIDPSPVALPQASWLASLSASGVAKLSGALLLVAAGSTLFWYGHESSPQPAPVARHAPPPPPAAPAIEPQPAAAPAVEPQVSPEAAPVVVRRARPARPRRAQPSAPAEPVVPELAAVPASPEPTPAIQSHRVTSPLDSELGLLRRAYRELHASRPASALEALAEHAYRFPRGELVEAREVARMLALCGLDREAEARALGSKFLAERPNSPFAGRVRGMCPVLLPKTQP